MALVASQHFRRAAERRRVHYGSRVTDLAGSYLISCTVHDISPAGAKITTELGPSLPESAYLLDLPNWLAYEARVVWRRPPELGLEFRRAFRFDEVPSDGLRKLITAEFS